MLIPKSKYLQYCQCPKILWLESNKPELLKKPEQKQTYFNLYNPQKEVDDFAKNLYGGKDATLIKNDRMDLKSMAEKTLELLKTESVVHKATFDVCGTYVVCDIVKKVKSGYMIYLVKNSKNIKAIYLTEMAYLVYMLKKINLPIYRTIIVKVNGDFRKKGKIKPEKFFDICFVGQKIKPLIEKCDEDFENIEKLINLPEPDISFNVQCNIHYPCAFIDYCRKPLPNPSIFDLHACNKKFELYSKNILGFKDLIDNDIKLNEIQKRQVDFELENLPTYVDKPKLKEFLKKFTYPLFFLDFETTQQGVPAFDGISPFEQIPFQYSLHYILEEGGELYHKEYLADEDKDPRIDLVKNLVNDIPLNSTIIAYNDSFEKGVIKKLAENFTENSDYLLKLTENFIDLIEPFDKGFVYDKLMGGSFSLKSVLPALYPDNPKLSYTLLEDVHNGKDARILFPSLKFMSEEDRIKERNNLLKYCFLDTYAMVKIWQKLKDLCEEKL